MKVVTTALAALATCAFADRQALPLSSPANVNVDQNLLVVKSKDPAAAEPKVFVTFTKVNPPRCLHVTANCEFVAAGKFRNVE